jgi:hypothetical protein
VRGETVVAIWEIICITGVIQIFGQIRYTDFRTIFDHFNILNDSKTPSETKNHKNSESCSASFASHFTSSGAKFPRTHERY